MKNYLLIILYSCTFHSTFSQQIINDINTNTINSKRKHLSSPIYIDANAGAVPTNPGSLGFANYNLASISIGYRISEKYAVGIAKTNFYRDNEITGLIGIQYRITPMNKSIFIIETGATKKARFGPTPTNEFDFDYLSKQSQRYYFRLSAGYRFKKVFSININYTQSGKNAFHKTRFADNTLTDFGILKEITQLFMWTLGINIPSYTNNTMEN